MKQRSLLITLAGGILAFFSFALPWTGNQSGAMFAADEGGLATIVSIVALTIVGSCLYLILRKPDIRHGLRALAIIMAPFGLIFCVIWFGAFYTEGWEINIDTISFAAVLVVIGTTIYMLNRQPPRKSWSTYIVLISSSVGLCFFLISFFVETLQYGAFLTAIGYILAMVGLLCFPKTEGRAAAGTEEGDATNS